MAKQYDIPKGPASSDGMEPDALAALIDAQLEEIVCGGWSKGHWDKINPN